MRAYLIIFTLYVACMRVYIMLDHLCLAIPFDCSLVDELDTGRGLLAVDLHDLEVPLAARSVARFDDGTISAQILYHPYESLPTSYTGMAMKVFDDARGLPYVEIKASPAKIMQGHNVFGSDSIELGAVEMLGYLATAYPTLYGMLHIASTEVRHLDVTYSARLDSEKMVVQVIDYLSRISNGQTKPTAGKKYQTTAYWGGQHSRLVQLKAYGKACEYAAQLADYKKLSAGADPAAKRVYQVMSDPRLIKYTDGLLRFEARIKKRKLERLGLPVNLWELIKHQRNTPDFLQSLWQSATAPVFSALEGQTMKCLDDDSVIDALKARYQTVTAKGNVSYTKAHNLFNAYCAIREHGLDYLRERFSKPRYHAIISDLIEAGFSKAYLQNLHSENKSNVVPLLRFINVDFSQQYPDWYVEPVSSFIAAA